MYLCIHDHVMQDIGLSYNKQNIAVDYIYVLCVNNDK